MRVEGDLLVNKELESTSNIDFEAWRSSITF
jgi:hypothetical protein